MSTRTRFTLFLGLTYTLMGRGKNQQVAEMETIKES
jgi:hypothetical protein